MAEFNTPLMNAKDTSSFQANQKFITDKEETWSYPMEKDGWILDHNSIRAEVLEFEAVLTHISGRTLKDWEKEGMKVWWKAHEERIHRHHKNEDDIMNPFLRTRIKYPEKLKADYKGIKQIMDKLKTAFQGFSDVNNIQPLWSEYKEILFPHLKEAEQVALPLIRDYFEPKKINRIVEKMIQSMSKLELGSFFHHTDTGSKHNNNNLEFIKQEGIPFFVSHIDFKKSRTLYRKEIESVIESLLRGTKVVCTHKAELIEVKKLNISM